ncbi:Rv1733c family protein [Streptomyces sp. YIM S03343]
MTLRGPKVWLWRWRRNPLRRRADAVEAWVVLGAWLLTVLAGVLAGLTTVRSVESGLARERAEWRPAVALVTEKVPGMPSRSGDGTAGERVWARVGWVAPDGSPHTGQARVAPGSAVGTPVTVWNDPEGHLVTRPATTAEAELRGVVLGGLLGVGAAAVPFVAGRVLRARLERRRMDRWDTEWARLGPIWGRKTG